MTKVSPCVYQYISNYMIKGTDSFALYELLFNTDRCSVSDSGRNA